MQKYRLMNGHYQLESTIVGKNDNANNTFGCYVIINLPSTSSSKARFVQSQD